MPSMRASGGTVGDSVRAALLGQRAGVAALTCYGVFLAWVLLWPGAGPASSSVDHTLGLLYDIGVPERLINGGRVEFVLNALMIVPVPLLAAWAGTRWTWERWTAGAFLAAGTVEVVQGLALANRSAQFQDIVANTLGTLIGALLCRAIIH